MREAGRRSAASLRLRGYRRAWLRWDLLAGVTTAAVVIPQAVAYASLAGLPVQVGLYVAIVPMVAYALVGTSRPLSVSSTSTISILTAGALVDAGAAGDGARAAATASLLALLVGGILAAAGLLRLGFLADFISSTPTRPPWPWPSEGLPCCWRWAAGRRGSPVPWSWWPWGSRWSG